MAIPCEACHQPVHEHAVICPHCGERSGVPVDPSLTADEVAATLELARIASDTSTAASALSRPSAYAYDPQVALLGGAALVVGSIVKAAVDAVVEDRAERRGRPELPRAIARARAPEVEPEPTDSPPPRVLK